MELKIRKDFEEIQPRMIDEEFESLKQSMRERGYDKAFPIIVDETDTILDGHHRYRACKELGLEPVVIKRTNFADDWEKKEFIWLCSLRRNLSPWQKVEQAKKWEKIEREKALARMKSGGPSGQLTLGEKGKTTEILAKKVGLGGKTLARGFKVIEKAPQETIEKLRKGEMSILEAYERTQALEEVEDVTKRKILEQKLESDELSTKELKKIVGTTKALHSLIETIPKEGQKEILEQFEEDLWTENLNLNKVKEEIERRYSVGKMEELEIEGFKFKSKEDAENFANNFRGNFKKVIFIFEFPKEYIAKVRAELEKR